MAKKRHSSEDDIKQMAHLVRDSIIRAGCGLNPHHASGDGAFAEISKASATAGSEVYRWIAGQLLAHGVRLPGEGGET